MTRRLGLNAKIAAAVAVTFLMIVVGFLLALVPYQRNQRQRFVERNQRLLEILREKYERDLVYDLLSQNRESLVVDMAELARQPEIVWVALDAREMSVSGTGDAALIKHLLADEDPGTAGERRALMIGAGGAALINEDGLAFRVEKSIATELLPTVPSGPKERGSTFGEIGWADGSALHYEADLKAADQVFGRLHIVSSLAELRRVQARTRTLTYGVVGVTFLVSLVVLNVLLSRLVVRPVHRVAEAMSRAQSGDLDQRLGIRSQDEIGMMGSAFDAMVAQLADGKRAIEEYSRDLERKVDARTHELRASEERLRTLSRHLETVIANAATGVVSTDENERIEVVNQRAVEILGLSGREMVGRTAEEVLGGRTSAPILAVIEKARRTGEVTRAQIDLRLRDRRRTVAVVASTLRDDDGGRRLGTVLVIDDLTDVIATQRLTAWKQAVERVIHEIKNPLTPIGLTTETLQRAFDEDRARFDELFPSAAERILGSVRALRTLISEFTQFYRMPPMKLGAQDPNALVSEVMAPFVQASPDGVTTRLELGDRLPSVEADAEQMKRVLLNVVTNGIEAMGPKPGTLVVRTFTEGDDVVIAVRDEGPGVEDVDRLFEPYYTTKAKGTGLGLVISRQVVEQHGGTLEVRSQVGAGTEVRIALPGRETTGA